MTTPIQQSSFATYNPTNTSDKTDITTFCNKLSFLVRYIPKHDVLIISGYMNAQIDKERNNKFWLQNIPDRKNEYLGVFSRELAFMPKH